MKMAAFYMWMNFFVFAGALIYFVRRPLLDFLSDRSEQIQTEIEETILLRRSSELKFKEYRKKMDTLETEIATLRKEFRAQGELEKKMLLKKAQEFSNRVRQDVKVFGEQEAMRVKMEIKMETLAAALKLAKSQLQQAINAADQERLMVWGIGQLNNKYERAYLS